MILVSYPFTAPSDYGTLSCMTGLRVIIRGRWVRKEFAEPYRQCADMLEKFGTELLINPVESDEPVDFAIFFQSYPHEFSKTDLMRLRRTSPFAPFFFILGVCCEGMLRTAGPLDSPFYRYAHGWNGKEPEQIRLFLTNQPSLFSLPLTAENDEIAQWENPIESTSPIPSEERIRVKDEGDQWACSPHPNPLPKGEGRVKRCLILTHFGPFGNDSAMNGLLADEYDRLGYEPVFSGKSLPNSFTGRILADADDLPTKKILESIQRLRRQFADNDFTVYVDSPRIDEKIDCIQAGATRILPKLR